MQTLCYEINIIHFIIMSVQSARWFVLCVENKNKFDGKKDSECCNWHVIDTSCCNAYV